MSNQHTKQYNKLLTKYNQKKNDCNDLLLSYIQLEKKNSIYKIIISLLLFIVLLFTFIPNANANAKDKSDSNLVKRNIDSVVEIYDLSEGYSGSGSGFYLTSSLIVTNKHVINSNTKTYILKNKDGEMFEGQLVYQSKEHDISILATDKKNKNYTPLCNYTPDYHQKIYSIGNSYGKYPYRMKYGHTTGIFRLKPVSDLDIKPGDSGSPVFDYDDHCVLGINQGAFVNGKEKLHSIYISNQFIYESWKQLVINYAIEKAKKSKKSVDK